MASCVLHGLALSSSLPDSFSTAERAMTRCPSPSLCPCTAPRNLRVPSRVDGGSMTSIRPQLLRAASPLQIQCTTPRQSQDSGCLCLPGKWASVERHTGTMLGRAMFPKKAGATSGLASLVGWAAHRKPSLGTERLAGGVHCVFSMLHVCSRCFHNAAFHVAGGHCWCCSLCDGLL